MDGREFRNRLLKIPLSFRHLLCVGQNGLQVEDRADPIGWINRRRTLSVDQERADANRSWSFVVGDVGVSDEHTLVGRDGEARQRELEERG